jgi:hypothetical protein
MAKLTLARTDIGEPDALDAVVEALRSRGYDATVSAKEPADSRAPRAELVLRFVSEEDGAGLARTAKHVFLAFRDATGDFPQRIAFYDHTGHLLNDTDGSLV